MKVHYFCIKFSNIFCGGGTALSRDPTPYPSVPYSKFLGPPLYGTVLCENIDALKYCHYRPLHGTDRNISEVKEVKEDFPVFCHLQYISSLTGGGTQMLPNVEGKPMNFRG